MVFNSMPAKAQLSIASVVCLSKNIQKKTVARKPNWLRANRDDMMHPSSPERLCNYPFITMPVPRT